MVEINIAYEGELHCKATHGPSGECLGTDAPVDNKGKGATFSPTDLVATSLGTCMLTIMGITAQQHGMNLEGCTAAVTKEMTSTLPRRIARLGIRIRVPGAFSDKDKKRLENAAKACPVAKSLHPDVDVPVEFAWD